MTFEEEYFEAKWGEEKPKEADEKTKETEVTKLTTSGNIDEVINNNESKKKINIEHGPYFGYEIEIREEKLTSILFHYNNSKYRIYFNYTNISPTIISNLEIQEKVKCGFSELRSVGYNEQLEEFIKKVLIEYSNY